jgi:hypothetical protein
MAAYRDRDPIRLHLAALLIYVAAFAGLAGLIAWRLWTAFASQLFT